ncbi:MAG TPA: cell envelope integrity protein TolA [Dissulfurispiraceae bacterium]
MKEQGLSGAFTLALFFHIMIVVIATIVAKHSNIYRLPSPYIVSLVDISKVPGPAAGGNAATRVEAPQPQKETPAAAKETKTETAQSVHKPTREESAMVSDRISALKAKRKVERIVALRKMIDVGRQGKPVPSTSASASRARAGKGGGGGSAGGGADYYSAIVARIRQQWVYPDSLDRDLEAIISIRIAKDGSVTLGGIEKSSGNRLFDRSVLNAISKASPLPSPPQEMEIGVRFRP